MTWKEIPADVYHGEYRSFISSSDLRRILRSPAHWRSPQPFASKAQEFGTLAHEAVLEPDSWASRCRPSSKIDRRTTEGKTVAQWQASQTEKFGIQFVEETLFNQIETLSANVHACLGNPGLLSGGMAELSGFTEINGCNARIRPDYLKDDYIIDLKTSYDSRIESFQRSIFQYGYDLQAAFYLDCAELIDGKKRKFLWVAVENESPYGVCVYEPNEAVLERGRRLYRQAINTYLECAELDYWPSYSTATQTIKLPRYMENV